MKDNDYHYIAMVNRIMLFDVTGINIIININFFQANHQHSFCHQSLTLYVDVCFPLLYIPSLVINLTPFIKPSETTRDT